MMRRDKERRRLVKGDEYDSGEEESIPSSDDELEESYYDETTESSVSIHLYPS